MLFTRGKHAPSAQGPEMELDDQLTLAATNTSVASKVIEPSVGHPGTFVWARLGARSVRVCSSPSPSEGAGRSETAAHDQPPVLGDGQNPVYSSHIGVMAIALYPGDPFVDNTEHLQPDAKPLVQGENEGFFTTTSTFVDCESSTQRSFHMYRATAAMGLEPDNLLSTRRTFEDGDGAKYRWTTSLLGHHECTRLLDGTVVVSFRRAQMPLGPTLGEFTLHQSVSPTTFQLLLVTCGTCYELQRRRLHKVPYYLN